MFVDSLTEHTSPPDRVQFGAVKKKVGVGTLWNTCLHGVRSLIVIEPHTNQIQVADEEEKVSEEDPHPFESSEGEVCFIHPYACGQRGCCRRFFF